MSDPVAEGFAVGNGARGSAPVTGFRRLFYGADGLRAGWSLLVYFALVILLEGLVKAIFRHFHHLDPDQMRRGAQYPLDLLITDGIPFAVIALVGFVMSRVERRSISAYGIGSTRGAGRQFAAGLFWGWALLSVLVLMLWQMKLLVFHGVLLSGFAMVRFAAEWAVGFLCVGLFEEYISRGFVLFTLARGIAGPLRLTRVASLTVGFWVVAAYQSWEFGAGHRHNSRESMIGLVSAGLLGLMFSLSLWRTGSLWWAIGMHTGWDWAQSFLYGVADSGHVVAFHLMDSSPQGRTILSGGLVGPEGSVLVFGVVALGFVVVLLTQRQRHWPPPGSNLAEKLPER